MEKIFVYNNDNEKKILDLVRYFRYNNTNYFIYTLNETDEKGYLKLYIVKIMKSLGDLVIVPVKDNKEWATMQDMIRSIIIDLKDQVSDLFEDLDYNELHGLTMPIARSFKLDKKLLVKLMSATDSNLISEDLDVMIKNINDNRIILKALNISIDNIENSENTKAQTKMDKYKEIQSKLDILNKNIDNELKKILNIKTT